MPSPRPDRSAVAAMIDHTLLRPDATEAEVVALCREAGRLGVGAVCVSPSRLPLPGGALAPGIEVAAVVGFPSGAHRPATKAAEAALAVTEGATEVDMVIDLGAATNGWWAAVEAEVRAVRAATGPALLKVIVESAVLGLDALPAACAAAEAGGADFVKTSTGFSPAGGATVEAVRAMRVSVGDRLGVKASGGVRTADAALEMIAAGATRLGTSSSAAILDGLG